MRFHPALTFAFFLALSAMYSLGGPPVKGQARIPHGFQIYEPQHRSPSESGRAQWTNLEAIPTSFATGTEADYLPFRPIARFEDDAPTDVTLHLRAANSGGQFDGEAMANFPNLNGGASFVVLVDYGDLAGKHRLVADMRSGSYRLPAITFAQVQGLQWNPAGSALGDTSVYATFSRAPVHDARQFTYTGAGTINAGATADIQVPFYADEFDLWANGWTGGIGAPNAPDVQCEIAGVYRNYVNAVWVPPYRQKLSGDVSSNILTILNNGPAAAKVFAQFRLRP